MNKQKEREKRLHALETILKYTFTDTTLLQMAVTHSSYAHEYLEDESFYNERLEFLGDAVLELAVSGRLYKTMVEQEGDLSRRRSQIVCEPSLAYIARKLSLGQFLYLSRGEEKNGGRGRNSILSDLVEAIIGAMYLDGGYDAAFAFIDREILSCLDEIDEHREKDYKTMLQEIIQAKGLPAPEYSLAAMEGPPHARIFTMQAVVEGKSLAEGQGRTKKEAEQHAAHAVYQKICEAEAKGEDIWN